MVEYEKEDFDRLLFNVHEVPRDKNLLKVFPKLSTLQEFKKPNDPKVIGNINEIIRYIVYFYDRNSPLFNIEDLIARKITAANLAGFPTVKKGGKNVFSDLAKSYINCENTSVNKMIIRFCRLQKSRIFSLLVTGNESYYNTLLSLMEPEDDSTRDTKDKQAIFMAAEKQASKLEDLQLELLQLDNNPYINSDLYDYVEEEAQRQLMISPEDYAYGTI